MSYSNELERSLSHTVERFGAALTLSQWSGLSFGNGDPSLPNGTCCVAREGGGGGGAFRKFVWWLESGGGGGGGAAGGGGALGGAEDDTGSLLLDKLSNVDELRDLDFADGGGGGGGGGGGAALTSSCDIFSEVSPKVEDEALESLVWDKCESLKEWKD